MAANTKASAAAARGRASCSTSRSSSTPTSWILTAACVAASLEQQGWIKAAWAPTETGREAKFYSLTRAGRANLEKELAKLEGSDSEEDIKKKLKGLGYIS